MSGFIWFLVGGITMTFVATVFFAVRWNVEYEKRRQCEGRHETLKAYTKHLEQQVHPRHWVDEDPAAAIRIKEKLYDKYEELLVPGTEVIRIEETDMPDPLPGWRNRVGDET